MCQGSTEEDGYAIYIFKFLQAKTEAPALALSNTNHGDFPRRYW